MTDFLPSSTPYHFVGYWGYGQDKEQQDILSKRLNLETVSSSSVKGNISYQVAFLPTLSSFITHKSPLSRRSRGLGGEGSSSFPSPQIIASLSASGCVNSPDVWVKVEGERLILGREPMGRVPLYWMRQGQVIWFASSMQLLLPLIPKPAVSIPGLYGYSCFSYVPTPLTPVEEIYAVPAGTELVWQRSRRDPLRGAPENNLNYTSITLEQWHSQTETIDNEEHAVGQLQTLLKKAIDKQLENLPSEPVGVFLSGGLDSSTVAALLVQAGVKVRAYSLDFGSDGISELPYAERVADFLNIPLVKVDATPRRIKRAISETAVALDLPFGDGVTIPLYLMCQTARNETGVIFNGENGDQLFAGWTNKPLIAAGVYNSGAEDFNQQYLRTFHRLAGYEERVWQQSVYERVKHLNPLLWLEDALDPSHTSNIMDRLRRASLMLKGAQNIQPRATNLALANGLWVRSPFCDLSLARWTFQLQGELYLHGAKEKYILKRAVESWLPEEIVWRKKRGMGVPLSNWCLNQLWREVGYWLNSGILETEGRWQADVAKRAIFGKLGAQIHGRRIGEILWLLMMWQVWRVKVLGEEAKGRSPIDPYLLPYQLQRMFKR